MSEASVEVESELAAARSQLGVYARDLKKVVAAERARRRDLEAAYRQLEAYGEDLKAAFLAEKRKSRELGKAYNALARVLPREEALRRLVDVLLELDPGSAAALAENVKLGKRELERKLAPRMTPRDHPGTRRTSAVGAKAGLP